MTSRRKLRRNVLRFQRYRARALRSAALGRFHDRLYVRAAAEAHYRALVRLEQHPAEAYARWRKSEGGHVCRPFIVPFIVMGATSA